jgi:nucleoside-diphosphate-sugar epimerase
LYETDPVVGVGHYGKAKIEAENHCLRFRENGLCTTIIRPKSFVGPERLGVFAIFYQWAHEGRNFPMIGKGDNRYQLLDVEDLCQLIDQCMRVAPELANDTYNIGAAEFTTMKQDYQAVLDKAGYGKTIIGFPSGPVILALKIFEKLNLSPLYPWIYETASKDSFVAIEKAQQFLGYDPRYSNQAALVRNYEWYLENADRLKSETGLTHRVPWNQKILKLIRYFF